MEREIDLKRPEGGRRAFYVMQNAKEIKLVVPWKGLSYVRQILNPTSGENVYSIYGKYNEKINPIIPHYIGYTRILHPPVPPSVPLSCGF